MAQPVEDPVLSLVLWFWLQLWRGFHPCPGNFPMPWAWKKKIRQSQDKPLICVPPEFSSFKAGR